MASLIRPEGSVEAPLNITAPAPAIDLKGFRWETVDKKIHGPVSDDHAQSPTHDDYAVGPLPGQHPLTDGPISDGHIKNGKVLSSEQAETHPAPLFPLQHFRGPYAGNGFNLIFRPRANGDDGLPVRPGDNHGPDDNILELNLTTEQLAFGGTLGGIPNRGLRDEPDISLGGLPYLQTVQDVTNCATGKGDHSYKSDIHFEPGIWLNVPAAKFQEDQASVVRMASIPHGTTINAQGLAPKRNPKTVTGGEPERPKFEEIDTTPFTIDNPGARKRGIFISMDEKNNEDFRIPQNLEAFGTNGTQKITSAIIRNPNLVLEKAIKGLDIQETITFDVSTGPPAGKLNGGGTANIAFLAGKPDSQDAAKIRNPTAHAASMKTTYWIERVMYKVVVDILPPHSTVQLRPIMPTGSTAPTPVFNITTGPGGNKCRKEISVPGIQIQSSQTVLLNFMTLSWPHVSVSTLVPANPQPFQMID